ncbi:hypothetical protein [Nonomuraea sp. NPDC003804]|uniref:hypothetical protein n=1 Tax=Nonomuraea sp. NPDC003804 TaxID=3154547 RepID=UPI0033A2EEC9
MLKRLLVSAALIGSALVAPVAASLPASAAVGVSSASAAHACTYGRSGNVWRCVTPGAYCPLAAHNRYGYARATSRRYKCSEYPNGQWRWKRV